MTRDQDPLLDTRLLLVDGTNLLFALNRGSRRRPALGSPWTGATGGPDPAPAKATPSPPARGAPSPPAAIIGRLRSAIPPAVRIQIVFDGPPEPGAARRIASGVEVRYGGRRSADAVLLDIAELAGGGVLVVTDDADLRRALHARGAKTTHTEWLIARLDRGRLSAPAIGAPRPPRSPQLPDSPDEPDRGGDRDSADGPHWHPGLGATRKVGNPRRAPKRVGGPGGGTRTRRAPRPPPAS